jgi:hypothetical protein
MGKMGKMVMGKMGNLCTCQDAQRAQPEPSWRAGPVQAERHIPTLAGAAGQGLDLL